MRDRLRAPELSVLNCLESNLLIMLPWRSIGLRLAEKIIPGPRSGCSTRFDSEPQGRLTDSGLWWCQAQGATRCQ